MVEWNKISEKATEALCKKRGMAHDLVDRTALWDSTLTFQENMNALDAHLEQLTENKDTETLSQTSIDFIAAGAEKKIVEALVHEKDKHLTELYAKTTTRQGNGAELLEEIRAFNPHCERITLSTLMAINRKSNIINLSPAGYGKSRGTKEVLDLMNTPYTEISGHQTPKDFFNLMKEAKGLVLIDESATLLKNNEILNLLLSALWSGKVSWRDETAPVEATIIFNTNSLPSTAFTEALKDRCQYNQIKLSSDKIKTKLLSDFTYTPNEKTWAVIKHNVFTKAKLEEAEVKAVREALGAMYPKSVRDKKKLLEQATFCKALFGSIEYLKVFNETDVMQEILESELSRRDKVAALAEVQDISVRTAQRIVKQHRENTQ